MHSCHKVKRQRPRHQMMQRSSFSSQLLVFLIAKQFGLKILSWSCRMKKTPFLTPHFDPFLSKGRREITCDPVGRPAPFGNNVSLPETIALAFRSGPLARSSRRVLKNSLKRFLVAITSSSNSSRMRTKLNNLGEFGKFVDDPFFLEVRFNKTCNFLGILKTPQA